MESIPAKQESKEHWAHNLSDILDNVTNEIRDKGKEHVIEYPREYRVTKSISPQELQRLSELPFETSLTEHKAGLTLITGQDRTPFPKIYGKDDIHTWKRTLGEARFTLHNHPGSANPTVPDVRFSYVGRSDIDLIVGKEGISVHKTRDLSTFFFAGFKRGMYANNEEGARRKIESGVLKDLIPWGDPRISIICDYINGNITWDECEKNISVSSEL